jgi:DNA-binding NtrC family response regulator
MHVLLIDDDAWVRATLRVMPDEAGLEITEAPDGEEGLRTVRRRPADLILCYLFMQGLDGLETIREFRREFPGVKVITMSGAGFRGTMDLLPVARRLGAIEVLHKPFNPKAATTVIERALRAKVQA